MEKENKFTEGDKNDKERKKLKEEKEKEAKRQEKIKKIKEKMKMNGYEKKNKTKIKNTSQLLFKKEYIRLIAEEFKKEFKLAKKFTFQEKREFLKYGSIIMIIKANLLLGTGRYLMLFYDNGLTLNILYKNIRK